MINVGRLFEIFTQQRFPAAIHRVRFAHGAEHKNAPSAARISLALFFAPGWEVVIEPPEDPKPLGLLKTEQCHVQEKTHFRDLLSSFREYNVTQNHFFHDPRNVIQKL